ncbi:MAG: SIMPL domain-containing protein [Rikenellaceae bacterium]|jgi:uncharacterized protein YggE|nr:SIMPL domain-containing protein [Rikenellaceae bacterium]
MKKMIMTVAAVIFVATAVVAQNTHGQYQNAIQVSGKAEKKVTPNEIYVAITVKDGDVKGQTVAQIESTMKSRLSALDIDVEKNLKATDMDNSLKKRRQVATHRSYELKLGDVWTLGEVFDMLGELGVSDASVSRVSHSEMEDFRREVRVEAIKNAKTTAEQITAAIGQSIGPAVYINDNGNVYEEYSRPVLMRSAQVVGYGMAKNDSAVEPTIDFKDITLSYQITVKFLLN